MAGQATIDLWNTTTGGTPSGGSHWRLFVDNVAGAGGNLTFGFYDAANARVAWGVDNSSYAVFNYGVTFSNATNIKFGSNSGTWTPTITAAGSMTVSAGTIVTNEYLRIGPIVTSV